MFLPAQKERITAQMKKEEFEDDGRTICNMNGLDVMNRSVFRLSGQERRADKAALREKIDKEEPLTRSEYRRYTWYSILAALTVLGIIGGGAVLFILILTLLWR
mgnify:CR=1 FL=1